MTLERYETLHDALRQQAEQHYLTHWRTKILLKDCAQCESRYGLLDALTTYYESCTVEEEEETTMGYIMIGDEWMAIDTAAEMAAAQQALREAGVPSAPVFVGDPEGAEGDSYPNGQILWAHSPHPHTESA